MHKQSWFISIIVFSIAIIKAIFFSFYGFGLVDEGQSLHNSLKIFSGLLPYKDFFAVFTPLHYYIYALPLAAFNNNLVAPRIFESVIFAFTPVLIYLILQKFVDRMIAVFPAILIIFLNVNVDRLYFLTLLLLGIMLLFRALEGKNYSRYFLSGLVFGISTLFRLDLSVVFFASIFFVLLITNSFDPVHILKFEAKKFGFYSLGFLLPIVVMLIWLISQGITTDFIQNTIIDSVAITKRHHVPFPSPLSLIPIPISLSKLSLTYSAIYGYAILLTYLLSLFLYRSIKDTMVRRQIAYFIIAGLLALPYIFGRSDMGHFVKGAIPFLFLSTWILSESVKRHRKTLILGFMALYSAIFIGAFSESYLWINLNNTKVQIGNNTLRVNRAYIENSTLPSASTLKDSSEFLRSAPQNSSVLVFPYMAGLYYLGGKTSPIRFDNLLPGYIKDSGQKDIINKISQSNVSFIIYDPVHGPEMENNSFENYEPEIHKYIMENYKVIKTSPEGWLYLIKNE